MVGKQQKTFLFLKRAHSEQATQLALTHTTHEKEKLTFCALQIATLSREGLIQQSGEVDVDLHPV